MSQELLNGLHENLWQSLRHIFNTDRVLLGVAYLVNFSGFVLLLALLPDSVAPAIIAFLCLLALNTLFFISVKNSKAEVTATINTLSKIYKDQELSQYFDASKANYYQKRYNLWLILIPSLMLFSVIVAVAIEYVA